MKPTLVPDVSAVRRWPTPQARAWASRVFPDLCRNPDVVALVLIGSSIRPAPSSFDFDCLFIYEGSRPEITLPPIEVDFRGYDANQVDQLIVSGHELLGWALRLGVLVCERDHYWTTLRGRWSNRLPMPDPAVADTRAKQAERLLHHLREAGDEDAAVEQCVTALTHRARAAILRAGIFPTSRPELPEQLRGIGAHGLARELADAIQRRNTLAQRSVDPTSRHTGAA